MHSYDPHTTKPLVISVYARYQHAVAMSEYHARFSADLRAEFKYSRAEWHEEQLSFWDKQASFSEGQLDCACCRELTRQVMRECRVTTNELKNVIEQFRWGLRLATLALVNMNASNS